MLEQSQWLTSEPFITFTIFPFIPLSSFMPPGAEGLVPASYVQHIGTHSQGHHTHSIGQDDSHRDDNERESMLSIVEQPGVHLHDRGDGSHVAERAVVVGDGVGREEMRGGGGDAMRKEEISAMADEGRVDGKHSSTVDGVGDDAGGGASVVVTLEGVRGLSVGVEELHVSRFVGQRAAAVGARGVVAVAMEACVTVGGG